MAVRDTSRKPYIVDNDSNVKVGIDLPIRRGDEKDGWMASTSTTIDAVKNNIRNLLNTNLGERLMQPQFGTDLRRIIFEPIDEQVTLKIQDKILDALEIWLPFVQVSNIEIVNQSKDTDNNSVLVNIEFSILKNSSSTDSVTVPFSSDIGDGKIHRPDINPSSTFNF